MRTVGILGGGQLGMLLSQSIERLGGDVIIFDPDPQSPACRSTHRSINAAWTDVKALKQLFEQSDVVTYEFENVESSNLHELANSNPLLPGLSVLQTTQNRILEKQFLRKKGLPHVNFVAIQNVQEINSNILAKLDFPIIFKSAIGGYDGKFQKLIPSSRVLKELCASGELATNMFPAVLEEALDLSFELSCLTIRSTTEELAFPIIENHHKDHILDYSVVPARIPQELAQSVSQIALKATRELGVIGLMCTEFFVTKARPSFQNENPAAWSIYINEFAPRPHNSGHITLSACSLSQFDALARVLLNMPVGKPRLLSSDYFCMGNLLGDLWFKSKESEASEINLEELDNSFELVNLVIYGKQKVQRRRKMGHIITQAPTAEEAIQSCQKLRFALQAKY